MTRIEQLEQALRELAKLAQECIENITDDEQAVIDTANALLSQPEQACTFCGGRGFIGWDDKARREANGDKWGRCLHCRPYLSAQAEQSERDELELIRAVLNGYPKSIARDDALRAVRVLESATPAQTEQQPSVFWVLFDATGPKQYIKMNVSDGTLAFFDSEYEAQRAKRRHPGTDYKRVEYCRAPIAPAPHVPDAIPMRPYQTVDMGSTNYAAGWNACRKAMLKGASAPQEQSGWVSVEDRLPEPNKKVLAHSKRCPHFFARRKNRTRNPWEFLDGDTCHEEITHWMPLPALPQGGRHDDAR